MTDLGATPGARSRFADRVAIVTGAGSGLGQATAQQLAAEGAVVAVLDLRKDAADEAATAIEKEGGTARAFGVDVSDPAGVRATVEEIAGSLGRPEILVNSAGLGQFAHTTEMTYETWARIIDVNLTGTFLMCQAALPHLLDGGGAIVNVASNSGLQGIPYAAAYCASKGGVVMLTKSLATEYAGTGVRVNAVAPGGMVTPLLAGFKLPEAADPTRLPRGTRLPHSQPAEIAELVLYLASDDARFVVGSVVSIDGGLTA